MASNDDYKNWDYNQEQEGETEPDEWGFLTDTEMATAELHLEEAMARCDAMREKAKNGERGYWCWLCGGKPYASHDGKIYCNFHAIDFEHTDCPDECPVCQREKVRDENPYTDMLNQIEKEKERVTDI